MKRVVVAGAAGYGGAELTGLLLGHPEVEVAGLFGSGRGDDAGAGGPRLADLHPRFRGLTDLSVPPFDLSRVASLGPDAVLLATPHEVSHELAPKLLELGAVVLDLSGAFRLDAASYPGHYGFEHEHPELLDEAVYGLPELYRESMPGARLIALPGCYPTSALLGLHPLVAAGALAPDRDVVICSTSGVSGAGRAPTARTHFCEVSHQPYGVLNHRHAPEIAGQLGRDVIFTPHLGPWDRGILSTIHGRLEPGWDEAAIRGLYGSRYGGEPFVRVLPPGMWPSVGAVRGANWCDLGFATDERGRHLILVSALDNLVKGAAGQAVQCLNIALGLAETAGLPGGATCLLTS